MHNVWHDFYSESELEFHMTLWELVLLLTGYPKKRGSPHNTPDPSQKEDEGSYKL